MVKFYMKLDYKTHHHSHMLHSHDTYANCSTGMHRAASHQPLTLI